MDGMGDNIILFPQMIHWHWKDEQKHNKNMLDVFFPEIQQTSHSATLIDFALFLQKKIWPNMIQKTSPNRWLFLESSGKCVGSTSGEFPRKKVKLHQRPGLGGGSRREIWPENIEKGHLWNKSLTWTPGIPTIFLKGLEPSVPLQFQAPLKQWVDLYNHYCLLTLRVWTIEIGEKPIIFNGGGSQGECYP